VPGDTCGAYHIDREINPIASFLSRLSLAKLAELERPRRHPKAFGIPSNLFRDPFERPLPPVLPENHIRT
jgi:hypothetical protein